MSWYDDFSSGISGADDNRRSAGVVRTIDFMRTAFDGGLDAPSLIPALVCPAAPASPND